MDKNIKNVLNLVDNHLSNLEEYQSLLEAIFLSTQDAISVVNEKGEHIMVNPAYTQITGISTDDILGKEFLEKVKYIITDFYNDEINLEYSSADGLFDIINNEFRSNALRYGSKSGQVSLSTSEQNKFSLEFKFSRKDKVYYKKINSLNLRDVTIIENPAILQYLPTIFSNSILNSLGINKRYSHIGVPYHVMDLWSKLKNSSLQSGDADSDNLFKVQLDDGFSISNGKFVKGVRPMIARYIHCWIC